MTLFTPYSHPVINICMKRSLPLFLTLICLMAVPQAFAQFIPTAAFVDNEGKMNYLRDTEGNRIPDFSHAGYRGGGIELPVLSEEVMINPIAGDNTAHIQAAIDQVSALAADSNGFRGAVMLAAGRYEIHGTLRIETSGVVLRGSGDGADTMTNTVLIGVGNTPNQRDILIVGGGTTTEWSGRVPGTSNFITTDRVLVGDYQIRIERPDLYAPGDNIVIYHPCTSEWLAAIDGGGAVTEADWSVASQPLVFNRRIVSMEDSTLTLDVPLYNTLDKSLSPSYIYKYDRAGLVTNCGVEDLRIDIETAGGTDEAHAWNAMGFRQAEDCWVTGCTFLHFGLAGAYTATSTRITIEDCRAYDPVAQVTGARMYNFNLLSASSQVLVKDCEASNGRHHYVSNGTSSVSGCVFLNCMSIAAYNASEGHRRWSMGLLYDQLTETSVRSTGTVLLGLYNRGDYGTAHGWSAAHSVAWNCDLGGARLVIQKPPTAQNYGINCQAQINTNPPWPGEGGFVEGNGAMAMMPESLYEAQLAARQAGLDEVITDVSNSSIRTHFASPDWSLFPNPSSGLLRIETISPQAYSARMYNQQGKVVASFSVTGSWEGTTEGIPTGIYVVELEQNGIPSRRLWIKR